MIKSSVTETVKRFDQSFGKNEERAMRMLMDWVYGNYEASDGEDDYVVDDGEWNKTFVNSFVYECGVFEVIESDENGKTIRQFVIDSYESESGNEYLRERIDVTRYQSWRTSNFAYEVYQEA